MKYCLLILCVGMGFILSSCDSNNQYDDGYESAWNGEAKPSLFSSRKYKNGYEQATADAEIYDDGYYDGFNGHRPKYSKDPDYMDGFKDGKQNK